MDSKKQDSGAMTPPPTPTKPSHSKTSSASSITETLSSLRRGDSTSRKHHPLDEPGSTEVKQFPHWLTDYDFKLNDKGSKEPLGSGLWSDVYLATPCLPKRDPEAEAARPITPTTSASSFLHMELPQVPPAYAIKVPTSKSAHDVLGTEARVLSYLSRFPGSSDHIVPFYGQDTRTASLVLKAMEGTLDIWTEKELDSLPEPARVEKLATVFPVLALALLDSLIWLHDKGCIHADTKPANILYTTASPLQVRFSDFSSSILPLAADTSASPPPAGGGTWDFLDPVLLSKAPSGSYPKLTPENDTWSLAISLLTVVLGSSPFSSVSNKFLKMDCIKRGTPFQWADTKRVLSLSAALGFDVQSWLGKVLQKDTAKRVSLLEWRAQLELLSKPAAAKI
ncbi:kinase-like protein [Corynespora cassiicola Philippines]|uniref:Autophagy-related protein 1 n=1 Tax=Corynespora cassiicola Philippines TaxID=1448308 RepID=A0A2T2P3R9_CORCC|nr:kinase-like protein [Corynespora cassiicola Philippines]